MNNRQEDRYDKLVARIGNKYYFCNYIFHDLRNKHFKGATGSVMRPVSECEAEERRENYDEDGEMWKNAVENDNTTLGKDDWWEWVLDNDGDDAISDADTYGKELMELLHNQDKDVELVECVGGGRCFDANTEYDEVFDQELLDKINAVETEEMI